MRKKRARKEFARVKALSEVKAALSIEPGSLKNQAKIVRIETREIASIMKATEPTESLVLRVFGLSRQSYWSKQKIIFSGKIFGKKYPPVVPVEPVPPVVPVVVTPIIISPITPMTLAIAVDEAQTIVVGVLNDTTIVPITIVIPAGAMGVSGTARLTPVLLTGSNPLEAVGI